MREDKTLLLYLIEGKKKFKLTLEVIYRKRRKRNIIYITPAAKSTDMNIDTLCK